MNSHPTELEIEQMLHDEATAEIAAHVSSCSDCQQLLQRLGGLQLQIAGELPDLSVPEELDTRMLISIGSEAKRIRGAVRERRQTRSAWRVLRWAGPAAAAAGVLFYVTMPMTLLRETAPMPQVQAGDVNADGRLDIVDAMLLAQALEQGKVLHPGWDADGDQNIDRVDVEHLARSAVHLGEVQP